MSHRTASELRRERYLEAHGHAFEFEPRLGTRSNPDYRISVAGVDVVCESRSSRQLGCPIGFRSSALPTQDVRRGLSELGCGAHAKMGLTLDAIRLES